ncbi:MAG: flagellar hook assembly protein FlgD [Alphaproteobacteria bacterium]|nr:flagellar hook assembly protein FlgD [Alphaproteobacteria bacterium]
MDVGAATQAAAKPTAAKATLSGNFDTFLRLLTTQLQNQDPLEPLDATKFTEQLVSYSQVEQQINTNSNLESLLALTKAGAGATAVSYLGKTALTSGPLSALDGGAASWRYVLPSDAASVQISILDANGKVVHTLTGEKTTGAHELTWDGKNSAGTQLPDSVYKLSINARDATGKAISNTVSGMGLVKEVDMSGAEPVIAVGNRIVKLSEILGLKN